MRVIQFGALTLLFSCAHAMADPVGTFDVIGTNPDNGQKYQGTVEVSRTGQTYRVVWNIGGTRYIGTGLGAKVVNGRFEMGPADASDTAISVGYVSSNTFGMAMYFQQPDGHWQGAWTYGGSQLAASEDWHAK